LKNIILYKLYNKIHGVAGAINAWAWQRSVHYLRKMQQERKK